MIVRQARRVVRAIRICAHLARGIVVAYALLGVGARSGAERARQRARAAQDWSRGLCRILNLRIAVRGDISTEPTLFVANHLSWLDIPCLYAVLRASFVAKAEVARWPVIGRLARCAGTMFLRRNDRLAVATVGNQMTWLLKGGGNVVLFPEGTTTDGRSVRRFHSGLYQAALRTHARIQAVAIGYPHPAGVHPAAPFVGDDNLLRHLWTLLAQPHIDVTLTFCPALAAVTSRHALAQRTRAQIADALGLEAAPCPVHFAGNN